MTPIFDSLAKLVRYPQGDYRNQVSQCRAALACVDNDSAVCLEPFETYVRDKTESELEELYTQTFDINPTAALEVGWHLFGENYGRGAFLVQIRGQLREQGIPEDGELPDHLGSILALLGRLPTDAAAGLGERILPALEKMRSALGKAASPYESVMAAIDVCVRNRLGLKEEEAFNV